MYHKDLDAEKIVEIAITLMVEQGPSAISFRSVARSLGCAHTNIYNFFKDSDTLFRACGLAILRILDTQLKACQNTATTRDERLRFLYSTYITFYLDHPGWYQLIWTFPAQLKDTAHSQKELLTTIRSSVMLFADNFTKCRSLAQAHHLLHIVHAYLLGEVSIYFAGRSLFSDQSALRNYVLDRCIQMTKALDTKETSQLATFLDDKT
jgi:AcrR family transcriptional regulator